MKASLSLQLFAGRTEPSRRSNFTVVHFEFVYMPASTLQVQSREGPYNRRESTQCRSWQHPSLYVSPPPPPPFPLLNKHMTMTICFDQCAHQYRRPAHRDRSGWPDPASSGSSLCLCAGNSAQRASDAAYNLSQTCVAHCVSGASLNKEHQVSQQAPI